MNHLARILVVDDSPVMRLILCQTLQSLGFDQIETAEDGQEAFRLLREQKFQAVFTDVEMPLMNGIELLQNIRLDLEQWNLPVFMVTTLGNEITKREVRRFEAAGFISKPYRREDVIQAIRKVLP